MSDDINFIHCYLSIETIQIKKKMNRKITNQTKIKHVSAVERIGNYLESNMYNTVFILKHTIVKVVHKH